MNLGDDVHALPDSSGRLGDAFGAAGKESVVLLTIAVLEEPK